MENSARLLNSLTTDIDQILQSSTNNNATAAAAATTTTNGRNEIVLVVFLFLMGCHI